MKYIMLKNKITGARSIRNNKDGSMVVESENPAEYARLRRLALKNQKQAELNCAMSELGLNKVRSVSGKVYWE
jgi:hypothetical protein